MLPENLEPENLELNISMWYVVYCNRLNKYAGSTNENIVSA